MVLKRLILFAIVSASVLFTAFFGRYLISDGETHLPSSQYAGIIKVWHIDGFEGGVGSRKQFLLSAAASWEKTHEGTLVMVISHTPESVRTALKDGILPDMISYCAGISLPELSELHTEKYFGGGMVAEKTRYPSQIVAVCRPQYQPEPVTVDDWSNHHAADAIRWGIEMGLIQGYPDGSMRPDEPMPMWRALTILKRYHERMEESK